MILLCVVGCGPAPKPTGPSKSEADPTLTVKAGSDSRSFTRSQLLADPDARTLSITDRSAYSGAKMTFRAVPVLRLFAGLPIKPGQDLHYETGDGFSSSLPADKALTSDAAHSTAFLAIEDPHQPWPRFAGRSYTAGPFYLVWVHPELSNIGREEWPFQVKALSLQPPIEALYPAILPDKALPAGGPVWRGYHSWVRNCFPCHTMNGQGAAHFGPDLNLPMNPTEYFQPSALRKLVRNPRSVRAWGDSKMSPFGADILPDPELDDVLAYLKHMAGRKRAARP
jgi:mono/diheme cytochrome c family protein